MWQCEEAVCRGGRPGSDLSLSTLCLSLVLALCWQSNHTQLTCCGTWPSKRLLAAVPAEREGNGIMCEKGAHGRSVFGNGAGERESARVCERLRERELPLGAVVKLNGDCRSATRERDLGRF